MPTLLSNEAILPNDQRAFLAFDLWQNSTQQPLLLECDAEPDASVTEAPAIAINFPAFNDGRGLSLAVLLRTRLGFTGELRAVGDVHQDILHYMRRCGFDSYELPDGRDPEQALKLLSPYSVQYQASVEDPQPHFRS
ncbi:MAG: DUF934 domain-containing protein [Pseudomonadaceae bacterium]|nr:DUF934 domain-containing protein [Pseudomonadaceae bacterium]